MARPFATATVFVVSNADGYEVGRYEFLYHAEEAAEDMARAAAQAGDPTNEYVVEAYDANDRPLYADEDGNAAACFRSRDFMATR